MSQQKITPEMQAQATEATNAILARSATDTEFRQKLLTDPRAAVSEATGRDIPASYNVRFIENTADTTIVLPDFVDPNVELADSELETVAGGLSPTVVAGVLLGAEAVAVFANGVSSD